MNVQRPKKNIRCHALPYSLETESLTEPQVSLVASKLSNLPVTTTMPLQSTVVTGVNQGHTQLFIGILGIWTQPLKFVLESLTLTPRKLLFCFVCLLVCFYRRKGFFGAYNCRGLGVHAHHGGKPRTKAGGQGAGAAAESSYPDSQRGSGERTGSHVY